MKAINRIKRTYRRLTLPSQIKGQTPSDVHEILRSDRRVIATQVIYKEALVDTIDLKQLTGKVAALEKGKHPHKLSASERKSVYTALYQSHLEKMDEYDVVDYNKDRNIITAGDNIGGYIRIIRETQEISEVNNGPW